MNNVYTDWNSVSRNATSRVIDELVKIGILEEDKNYAKKAYKYKEIYDVFVGKWLRNAHFVCKTILKK